MQYAGSVVLESGNGRKPLSRSEMEPGFLFNKGKQTEYWVPVYDPSV